MSSAGIAVAPVRNDHLAPSSHLNLESDNESIWVYLAFSGSMIPMRILESDSIESLKLRIQSCKGFVVKNQKLVCGGRELARSNSLVRDYGVNDGNVLHLVLRLSDLQAVNVKTFSGKDFTFHVQRRRGFDVAYLKRQIAKRETGFTNLDEQEIVFDGEKLEDQRLIDDICKHNNDAVLHLSVRKSADVELSIVAPDDRIVHSKFILDPVIVNTKFELPSAIAEMIASTLDGLYSGRNPIRSMEGTGGAYFMQDSSGQKFVSVFKPIDEEPLAVNNPRELPISSDGEGLKKGTRVGQGAFREVAAYILDHPKNSPSTISDGDEKGFAGVPPTAMVKCLHNEFNNPNGSPKLKLGSLQMFTENSGSCEDIGPGSFPLDQVHKISVLDIRLANADRHGGNILLSKDEDGHTLLVPIDHGYCLPESFEDCTFDWLYWPQARRRYSPEIVEYIKSLDAEKDIALLKYLGWDMSPKSAHTLRISTMLLKKGAARGLTPFVIGSIMCRENLNEESVIERIIQETEKNVGSNTSEVAFLEKLSEIMNRCLDKIVGSL